MWGWTTSPVARFIARRGLTLAVVLSALVVASFAMVHLIPGDPARRIGGIEADEAQVESIRNRLGLNDPLLTQFGDWVSGLLSLDWGTSFVNGEPAWPMLSERFGSTFQLAAGAIVVTLIVSLVGGIAAAALTRGGRRPRVEMAFGIFTGGTSALPSFLAGTFLAFIFAVELGWLPVAGDRDGLRSALLPIVAISLAPTANLMRVARLEALAVLSQDYIRVARSRGVGNFTIYRKHVLPNVLVSALTLSGLTFGMLLGSTVVVENVFDWPGLGPALVEAVSKQDYPIIQGAILLLGASVVVVNALVDASLAVIDRRSAVGAL